MLREGTLEEISDGRFYELNDMAKLGCNDCAGCSACCRGMGNSILLDPWDIRELKNALNMTFEQLLESYIELNVVQGIILPNIRMINNQCPFLNKEGRCSIHKFRPGVCRLFPLGRYYDNNSFKYILQVNECKKNNRTKVKIEKWLDIKDIKTYEKFVLRWHYYIKEKSLLIKESKDENLTRQINLEILNSFFVNDEIENLIN